jgi:hypothetical protein
MKARRGLKLRKWGAKENRLRSSVWVRFAGLLAKSSPAESSLAAPAVQRGVSSHRPARLRNQFIKPDTLII